MRRRHRAGLVMHPWRSPASQKGAEGCTKWAGSEKRAGRERSGRKTAADAVDVLSNFAHAFPKPGHGARFTAPMKCFGGLSLFCLTLGPFALLPVTPAGGRL